MPISNTKMQGQTLSHYRVLKMVGQGASGVIYQAEDLSLGRLVALKCLRSDLFAKEATVVRFQHEARTASSINHPNICTIHEISEHEGRQFIVMEWLEGRTLADLIDRRPLKLEPLFDYAIQIADGLHAAHTTSIVHRDVKPSNILITTNGQAKILDFGISSLVSPLCAPQLREPTALVGTAPYVSPEQIQGDVLDLRSDLFSLGVVLYEMATGRRPFIGGTIAEVARLIVEQVPKPPRTLNPDIPVELDRIVMKALEKNPKLRFQTAADLRADLLRLRRDFDSGTLRTILRPLPNPLGEHVGSATPWLMTGQAAIAGTIASTVLLLGLGFFASRQLMRPPNHVDAASEVVERKPIPGTNIFLPSPEKSPVQAREAAPPPLRTNPEVLPGITHRESGNRGSPNESRCGTSRTSTRDASIGRHEVPRCAGSHQGVLSHGFCPASSGAARRCHGHVFGNRASFQRGCPCFRSPLSFCRSDAQVETRCQRSEAREVLAQLANTYPDVVWAPRALMMKAGIEERKRLYERDRRLAIVVPSALVTYRRLISAYPAAEENSIALEKLAKLYEEIKRFDLAAATFVDLGTRYPSAEQDAWYRAAELYRRRLNDAKWRGALTRTCRHVTILQECAKSFALNVEPKQGKVTIQFLEPATRLERVTC